MSGLSDKFKLFDAYYESAWEYGRAGQYDKANDICKWLLLQQDLGQYHQAGAPNYEKIKTHCDGDTKWAEERVAAAETLLREAEEDKKKYSEPMTDEEYDQAMIEASDAKYQADQAWPHLVSDDEEDDVEERQVTADTQITQESGVEDSQTTKESQSTAITRQDTPLSE